MQQNWDYNKNILFNSRNKSFETSVIQDPTKIKHTNPIWGKCVTKQLWKETLNFTLEERMQVFIFSKNNYPPIDKRFKSTKRCNDFSVLTDATSAQSYCIHLCQRCMSKSNNVDFYKFFKCFVPEYWAIFFWWTIRQSRRRPCGVLRALQLLSNASPAFKACLHSLQRKTL